MLPSEYPEVHGYPNLKKVLEALVDMQFVDLRALVRLPAYGIKAGMNLTTAARLFDTISGCSICFYNTCPDKLSKQGISAKEFKGLLEDFFPWNAVPVGRDEAIDVFYVYARNPLAHALGVDVRPGNPDIELTKRNWPLKRVLELEDSPTLPKWIKPPLIGQPGSYVLNPASLFWGVHRMLHSLFGDSNQVAAAEVTAATIPV